MKKTLILKKNYQFRRVLSKGKHYSGKFIDIVIINNNKDKNYIGIAINSKAANAVKRNRLKRLIKECYRILEPDIINGYSLVFLCKKNVNISNFTLNDINNDMINILKRAGMYNL